MIPGLAGVDLSLIGRGGRRRVDVLCLELSPGRLAGRGRSVQFFYRLALHILVGAGVAYALLVAGWGVLYPYVFIRLASASAQGNMIQMSIALIGVLLGVLMLTKGIRAWAWLGNIATGYLIGVGLGVAAGGAVLGTLYAQSVSTATLSGARTDNPVWLILDSLVLVLGTLTVLLSFTFHCHRSQGIGGWAARWSGFFRSWAAALCTWHSAQLLPECMRPVWLCW